MTPRKPDLGKIVDALRNSYFTTRAELTEVEDLVSQVQERDLDSDARESAIHRLVEIDTVVRMREATPTFEGVPFRLFERAIELARQSVPEDDHPGRPLVGAVIVCADGGIAEAHRNRDAIGGHAEQIVLEAAEDPTRIEGATVLTTLEPCTKRGREGRRSCAELLIKFGVARVFIGLPDPNDVIRGKGDLLLRANGIEVAYFPPVLAQILWTLNRRFVAHHTSHKFRQVYLYRPE